MHDDGLIQKAIQHMQAGDWQPAVACCSQLIANDGSHLKARELRAIALLRQKNFMASIQDWLCAIQLGPQYPQLYVGIAEAYRNVKEFDAADAAYQRALQLAPNSAEIYYQLGNMRKDRGLLIEAAEAFRSATERKPDFVEAWSNLGYALKLTGNFDQAIASFKTALQYQPDRPEILFHLATTLIKQGQTGLAIEPLMRAVRNKPDFEVAYVQLATLFFETDRFSDARRAAELGLQRCPRSSNLFNLHGIVLQKLDLLDEAEQSLRQAVHIEPTLATAWANLGNILKDGGRLDEAMIAYRRSLELKPDQSWVYSNLLSTLYFHPGYTAQQIHDEHRRWNERFAQPLFNGSVHHSNDRTHHRRLRIGYVSPNLCGHPVGRFMLPVFREHDHQEFEIVAYSSTRIRDAHHDEFRKSVDLWRDVQRVTDADLADIIREDRIDILVDLSMHMAHHRLLTFARQPSPIQVTYLAYCGTTGLDTIQYRLTDPHLDPPEASDDIYSENSVRFFDSYWCYEPHAGMEIDIGEAPHHKSGVITFGCLNNFCKISESTLSVWAGILRRVPRSRLLLHAMYGSHRERVLQRMVSQNIDAGRLAFVANVPFEEYMSLYNQIDIAFDPFPYGGGTTTCDALWMGVPVITLRGETAVGRGGASILTNLGEANLIATNIAEYEAIALELASESSRLDDYRQRLRPQMQRSPLMDRVGITRALERTYRQLWIDWTMNRTNCTNKECSN